MLQIHHSKILKGVRTWPFFSFTVEQRTEVETVAGMLLIYLVYIWLCLVNVYIWLWVNVCFSACRGLYSDYERHYDHEIVT